LEPKKIYHSALYAQYCAVGAEKKYFFVHLLQLLDLFFRRLPFNRRKRSVNEVANNYIAMTMAMPLDFYGLPGTASSAHIK
jgi:hypothetical protein